MEKNNPFKVGDRVRCINNSGAEQLDLNKVYTVFGISDDPINGKRIHVVPKNEQKSGWFSDRFELSYIKEFKNKLEEILND